jgi:hypothetical protein
MAETKELLERAGRAFDLPSDVMDALVARRDRKRRNERLQAGALGLAIAVAIGWLGVSALRSGPVPADPPPGSWSRVQLEPPVDGGSPASFLVAGPDGLVAVGVDEGPATVWTSADGTAWTRTPAETLDGAAISDITNGDLGFIAVGDSGGERASWTSEDGISWDRLPDPDLGDTLFVSAVEPGGPGFVAVGSWMGAWYSVDGITWERAAVPPVPSEVYPGDDGKTPQIYLSDVAGWRDRLVATGYAMLTSDGNFDHPVAVLWTSRDGRAWTDVPTPAVVFPPDSSISDVTAGPDGFVAVGRVANGQEVAAAIWTSPDGRDWLLHRPGPDGLVLNSVTAGAGGYVAVGATMECDTDCASREAVVMTSVDGETWVTVPSGPDFRVAQPSDPEDAQGAAMFDVVAWGSRFAALGEYDAEPTVWVTTLGDQEDVTTPTLPEPALVAPGTLAYVLDGDVYVADPDGSNAVKIANGLSTEDCYAWSGEYWAEGPMWSPDGRYLAFRRYTDCGNEDDPNPRDVVISDAAGNVVATFPADGWDIGWSPNSSRVAVWDTLFETVGIYGIDGTRLERLTMPSGWQPSGDHDPAWTSDGSLVLSDTVLLDDGDPTNDVARNLEARDDYAATIGIQAISSDGARIATVDGSSLMVGGSDGSGSVALLTVDRGTDLRILGFSPDGDRILFAKNEQPRQGGDAGELWSIGVDGSDARLVVAGTMTGSWRP